MTIEQHDWLADADPKYRDQLAQRMSLDEKQEFAFHWPFWARQAQLPPEGDWRVWMVMAGRGFGKTRTGAEWVRDIAERDPEARIALVSASLSEARTVMVEGESGLMSCCPPDRMPVFESSLRRVRFPNGAIAQLYSAAEPETLRGPQNSHAWCDEIGKWRLAHDRPTRCWDNLLMGLRLGDSQKIVVTTTPRNVPLVLRLLDGEKTGATVVTRGTTNENVGNLPQQFLSAMNEEFGGTQLARQELGGELLADIEGALWTRALIERSRRNGDDIDHARVVLAVDPPASARGDACGIVIAAIGADGIGRVLADCSVERASPEQWAQAVANAALIWNVDRVIAEANQGGAMVESVLRAADCALPVKLVHASRSKVARAEPVAALYEAAKVQHIGLFPRLEDQLCGLMAGGTYEGPGRSPDRADALVWALSELMLGRARIPRVVNV